MTIKELIAKLSEIKNQDSMVLITSYSSCQEEIDGYEVGFVGTIESFSEHTGQEINGGLIESDNQYVIIEFDEN